MRISQTYPWLSTISVLLIVQASLGRAAASRACPAIASKVTALAAGDIFQANILLFAAAGGGCLEQVTMLLNAGASPDARDRLGQTALARAAVEGRDAIVELLLAQGAKIDAKAVSGSTPLFLAAENDRTTTLRLLLKKGAEVDARGRSGLTALAAAAYNGNQSMVATLLSAGASPNVADDDGKGPIVYAASRGFAQIVQRLLDADIDVNRRYGHGLTALMWAAGHADDAGESDIVETLKVLLDKGADASLTDDRGLTALEIARILGHREVMDVLAARALPVVGESAQSPAR